MRKYEQLLKLGVCCIAAILVMSCFGEPGAIGVTASVGTIVTDEDGGSVEVTLTLGSEPNGEVTLAIATSDPSEGTVSPTSVTMDPSNWDVPQTFVVTGVDDDEFDGNQPFILTVDASGSTDPDYSALDPIEITCTNEDRTEGLIAADGTGTVWRIDPADGSTSLVVSTGLTDISSMVFDPSSDTLYAGTGSAAACAGCLYTVDLSTGATEFVLRAHDFAFSLDGMSRRPSDDGIFAFELDGADIRRLHPDSGTSVSVTNVSCCAAGYAMSFDGSDTLYRVHAGKLYVVDVIGGGDAVVGSTGDITFAGFTVGTFSSMALRPSDQQMFVLDGTEFGTLNVESLQADLVGTLSIAMDGLTYVRGGSEYPQIKGLAPQFAFTDGFTFDYDITWKSYPVADSFNLYYSADSAGINPDDSATYTGVFTGLSGTLYHHTLSPQPTVATTYYYLLTAVVDGMEIAQSIEVFTLVLVAGA